MEERNACAIAYEHRLRHESIDLSPSSRVEHRGGGFKNLIVAHVRDQSARDQDPVQAPYQMLDARADLIGVARIETLQRRVREFPGGVGESTEHREVKRCAE